ncbi:MAG TPA: RDD family protein [Bacilli bacterium]|nr:RDD family protein [Bacilli bacterium]
MKFKNKVEVIENTQIQGAPILRRVGATLIDFAAFFLIFFLVGLVVRPIFNATTNLATLSVDYQHSLKKSNLVTLDQELAADFSNIDEVNITLNSVGELKYAKATYDFYTVYMQSNFATSEISYDHEWYLANILKINETNSYYETTMDGEGLSLIRSSSDLSDATSTSEELVLHDIFLPVGVSLKATTTVADVTAFNRSIYSGAIAVFNAFDFVNDYREILLFESILNMLVAASVIYLTIPLLLKNGQTLGKLLLKMGLTTTHGYKFTGGKIAIRFLIFFLLYLLSIQIQPLIWMVILFISLTISIFSKKNLALHDFVCGSRVIDLKKSVVYDNARAFIDANPPVNEVKDYLENEG